jgi:hypothetical protein
MVPPALGDQGGGGGGGGGTSLSGGKQLLMRPADGLCEQLFSAFKVKSLPRAEHFAMTVMAEESWRRRLSAEDRVGVRNLYIV